MHAAHSIDRACATAAGARAENQDRCVVGPGLGVVSDGVGGHAGGARAAELTVQAVVGALGGVVAGGRADGAGPAGAAGVDGGVEAVDEGALAAAVAAAVQAANDAVRAGRAADPAVARMGATVALAAASALDPAGRSRWVVAHVGDSPAWLVTAAGCSRLTDDHTLTAELVRAGSIDAAAAGSHPGRHVLARAIGPEGRVAPDVVHVELLPGDALVLASDGLADVLGPAAIHGAVTAAPTADEAARCLVEASLDAHTTDNVTVAVLRQLASSPDGPRLPDRPR
jgi:protein phosphatase